jgi:hypothetical protein
MGSGQGRVTGGGLACEAGATSGCTADVPNPGDVAGYTTVTLRAEPLAGSVFKAWSGCTAVAGDPAACTVLVNNVKYVTARFEPDQLPVTFRPSGGGGGSVSGPGFTCPLTADGCTVYVANPASSAAYTTITLTASPDATSVLKGWSGCTPLADATCSLKVDGVENVTVKVEPSTYALNVMANGPGTVTGPGIDCSPENPAGCSATVANGASVRLVAAAADGYVLKSWYGCTPAPDGSCTVTMSSVKYVTATFQPATYPLTLGFSGSGSGSIAAGAAVCSPADAPCTVALANGASVTLVPTAAEGSRFTGWSGSCAGTGACTVTMTMARTVYAGFASP